MIMSIIKNKNIITEERVSLFVRRFLIGALIVQQFLLYSWYYFNGQFTLRDALPLYPCRISELLCILVLLKFNKKLFEFLYFWGLFGAGIALIVPDTSGAGFPNAMFIQFYLGHVCIVLTIIYVLLNYPLTINKQSFKNSVCTSLLYISFIISVNTILGSNYAYLKNPPAPVASMLSFPFPLYVTIYITVIFFVFYIMHIAYIKNKPKACNTVNLDS